MKDLFRSAFLITWQPLVCQPSTATSQNATSRELFFGTYQCTRKDFRRSYRMQKQIPSSFKNSWERFGAESVCSVAIGGALGS